MPGGATIPGSICLEAFALCALQICVAEPSLCLKLESLKAGGQAQFFQEAFKDQAELCCQGDLHNIRNPLESAEEAEQNLQFWVHKSAEMPDVHIVDIPDVIHF